MVCYIFFCTDHEKADKETIDTTGRFPPQAYRLVAKNAFAGRIAGN
jgi:hypothetical protein